MFDHAAFLPPPHPEQIALPPFKFQTHVQIPTQLDAKMSLSTFEEHKGLALEACFNDKRRHRRLIGHQTRTFDFQVGSAMSPK